MEALHRPMDLKYDSDKITKIRNKIEIVFGRASTWDDVAISKRWNITGDGDLITDFAPLNKRFAGPPQ